MTVHVGVKLGQKHEASAICAVEGRLRTPDGHRCRFAHFTVRFLERLPPGTSFPKGAARVGEIVRSIAQKMRLRSEVFLDATGLGSPIVSLLQTEVRCVNAVFFNFGDRRIEENHNEIGLGKAWLIARLQLLLQTQRLHLPENSEARILAKDLLDYQIEIDPNANERYGAFKVGAQDDLVTALGLAVQVDPSIGNPRMEFLLA